ncbi:MAG: Trm112 family protein [Candidatus Caldarchaeum sp.]
MKYRLLDILACPMCKGFPLRLSVFEQTNVQTPPRIRKCELYCGFHGGYVKNLGETLCEKCYEFEVVSGLLECTSCGRWFSVVDAIPRMLPDDLRDRKLEQKFVEKWRENLPEKILKEFSLQRP